jgi:hypothetical protein
MTPDMMENTVTRNFHGLSALQQLEYMHSVILGMISSINMLKDWADVPGDRDNWNVSQSINKSPNWKSSPNTDAK